jgi:two-component sensor histidine kinase
LFDFTGEGTIEAWVKITTTPPSANASTFFPIVAKDEGSGDINKWVFGVQNGKLAFHINNTNEIRETGFSQSFIFSTGKYYHFSITKDKNNLITFYVNGLNTGSYLLNHATPIVNAPLLIGGAEPRLFMHGEIYEVRFWKKALNHSEIKEWMFRKISSSHAKYSSLAACFITLNKENATVIEGGKNIVAQLESGPIPMWDRPFLPSWLIALVFAVSIVILLCIALYRTRVKMHEEKLDMALFVAQMSHESNNGIGMMINILSLQLNEKGVGHLETQLKHRLETIANLQSTEYIMPGDKEIAFRKYITDLVEKMNLAFNQGKQIVYEMDLPEQIKAKYAMKLAILIRELTLNSLKHAFNGKTHGEINISIKPAGKGLFRFEFCDNGSGLIQQKNIAFTAGTALINAVSTQLGGEPEVVSLNGYKFVLLFRQ